MAFSERGKKRVFQDKDAPLAERMRPRTISEYVGQAEAFQDGNLLPNVFREFESAIESGYSSGTLSNAGAIPNMILWGPPGCGKTALSHLLISYVPKESLYVASGTTTNISKIREMTNAAEGSRSQSTLSRKGKIIRNTSNVIFVDEIHAMRKDIQNHLLGFVEDGTIRIMGTTTENPSFSIIPPLLSRTTVVSLKKLTVDDIMTLLRRAITARVPRGLGYSTISTVDNVEGIETILRGDLEEEDMKKIEKENRLYVEEKSLELVAKIADGDARTALNMLELAFTGKRGTTYTLAYKDITGIAQNKFLGFRRRGDDRYDMISALIKSMRASELDAAVYWGSYMLQSGEDPLYITRRLIQFSSEDIGLADPNALIHSMAVHQAVQAIGMPECVLNVLQGISVCAIAEKSRDLCDAHGDIRAAIDETVLQEGVPLAVRNPVTRMMKDMGYGEGYEWTVGPKPDIAFLPKELEGKRFLSKYLEKNDE